MNGLSKLFVSLLVLMISCSAIAANKDLDKVIEKSSMITTSAANSQKVVDGISDDINSKLQKFKTVSKETEGLKVYNHQLVKQIKNQLREVESLNSSMDQVSVIERQITPLILRMIAGLKDFVALDIPFLAEERQQRIDSLDRMMDLANIAVSEKFRRILEAYQIENDYGRTIEAYSEKMDLNGNEQDVEFLRIGRVAFVLQTRDRQTMKIWNQKQRQWQPLDASYRGQISKGLRMARKQLAPDLITIPVYTAE